jgi:hypothetical protein
MYSPCLIITAKRADDARQLGINLIYTFSLSVGPYLGSLQPSNATNCPGLSTVMILTVARRGHIRFLVSGAFLQPCMSPQ